MKAGGFSVWINVTAMCAVGRFESSPFHSLIVLLSKTYFHSGELFFPPSTFPKGQSLMSLCKSADNKHKWSFVNCLNKQITEQVIFSVWQGCCVCTFIQSAFGMTSIASCALQSYSSRQTVAISLLSSPLPYRTPSIKLINSNCLSSLCLLSHHIQKAGGWLWI